MQQWRLFLSFITLLDVKGSPVIDVVEDGYLLVFFLFMFKLYDSTYYMWRSEPGIQCPDGGGQKALPQRKFNFRNQHGANETFFLQFEKAQKSFQANPSPDSNPEKITNSFVNGAFCSRMNTTSNSHRGQEMAKPGTQDVGFLYLLFDSSQARWSPGRPTRSDPGSLTKLMTGRGQQRLLNLTSVTPRTRSGESGKLEKVVSVPGFTDTCPLTCPC